jgi:hypothetical protein
VARLTAEGESKLRQARMEAEAHLAAELSVVRSQLSAAGGAAEAALRSQMDDLRRRLEGDMEAQRKRLEAEADALKAAHAKVGWGWFTLRLRGWVVQRRRGPGTKMIFTVDGPEVHW